MNTKTIWAALALATGLALTGCTTSGGPEAGSGADEASAPAADAVAETTGDQSTQGVADFGSAWTWDDGLKLTVKPAGLSTAGEYASGAEASDGKMYVFDVSLQNGTSEVFDPAILTASVAYGDEGTQAEGVFTEKIDGFFEGKVLPGKKQSTRVAFGIPAGELDDVTLTYLVDFDHEDALFSGALAK
ncbi:MAG: hypothetical protein ACTHWW_11160 [Arthrobacter sp.]|uniref:hypothetical protein n=1 Tax=unclassified Arthrobacter TaxID=235627 RepID=UPI00265664F2|nr:hypothetical protein [Micrococcaceae bacterium]MDN5813026.1 hypothetical protein [Micrococcaceae bacterium]MDN5823485.1 hypothetical protein [Micrococcaceae bacterium]MDN5879275.1 hypothetical protein [Micrococcaceae bacterium]MDN5887290.1 hypothetical protein [Micrococcaceae bacterium]